MNTNRDPTGSLGGADMQLAHVSSIGVQLVTLLRSHDPPFCFPVTRLDYVPPGLVSRSLIG